MLEIALKKTSEGRSYQTLRHRSTCADPSLMPLVMVAASTTTFEATGDTWAEDGWTDPRYLTSISRHSSNSRRNGWTSKDCSCCCCCCWHCTACWAWTSRWWRAAMGALVRGRHPASTMMAVRDTSPDFFAEVVVGLLWDVISSLLASKSEDRTTAAYDRRLCCSSSSRCWYCCFCFLAGLALKTFENYRVIFNCNFRFNSQ